MEKHFTNDGVEYFLSDDKSKLQPDVIHSYLSKSYWSEGIPKKLINTAIDNSLCFGLYLNKCQIGFARVTTDKCSFAYLADVFILPEFSQRGLGTTLIDFVMKHQDLQGLRRFMLCTRDAHNLYKKFGFSSVDNPETMMQIARPGIYLEQG